MPATRWSLTSKQVQDATSHTLLTELVASCYFLPMPGIPGERLPTTLYHYTDIYGLQGIYEKGELWATHGLYLNDTSEISLGLSSIQIEILRRYNSILEKRSNEFEQGNDPGPPSSEMVELDILRGLFDDYGKYSECYVVSLSAVGDQLSQWRAYAKDGYCIGFSTVELRKTLTDNQYIGRVKYNSKSWEAIARKNVQLSRRLWRESVDWGFEDKVRRFMVMNEIVKAAAFLKDSHFDEEKEIRIVEAHAIANHFTPSVRFGMTPRIKIPITARSISTVTVGPGVHADLRAQSLIRYFSRTRFKGNPALKHEPTVRKSVIPYRDW